MIPISKLRERLKLPADQDSQYADIKASVVSLWEEETKRLWDRRVGYVEVLRVPPCTRKVLFLGLWPIEVVTKVEERTVDTADWTEIPSTDWLQTRENRLERLGAFWLPVVRVTYTGGYVAADPTVGQTKTPADVAEALLVQADFQLRRNRGQHMELRSQNFEGGAGVYETGTLHPFFKRLAAQKVRKV